MEVHVLLLATFQRWMQDSGEAGGAHPVGRGFDSHPRPLDESICHPATQIWRHKYKILRFLCELNVF